MTNPYIAAQKGKFDALTANVRAITDKAAEEKRDLSDEEVRSVTEQNAAAKKLAEEITALNEAETRAKAVGEVAAKVETEERSGRAYTQNRNPGHYRSEEEGGQYSFFSDQYRAQVKNDRAAQERLDEYNRAQTRALTQAANGPGTVLPKYLVDQYQTIARQTRVVADRVFRIPLGDDPRPINMGKATVGTDANILVQSAEGANTAGWGTDRYDTDKDTLTPDTYAAYQDVARQWLTSGTPATDILIMNDLRSAWDSKVESLVVTRILADGTATGSTFANEAAFKTGAIDGIIDAQTAVAGDLRGPADLIVMNYRRFGNFRKLKDSSNRPIMPVSRYNPQNANGSLGNVLVGDIEGSDVVASNGVPTAYAEKYAVLRSQAVILGESDLVEFTYDQVVGPSAVRMGIWGYVGVLVRNPGSVSVSTVTAAT